GRERQRSRAFSWPGTRSTARYHAKSQILMPESRSRVPGRSTCPEIATPRKRPIMARRGESLTGRCPRRDQLSPPRQDPSRGVDAGVRGRVAMAAEAEEQHHDGQSELFVGCPVQSNSPVVPSRDDGTAIGREGQRRHGTAMLSPGGQPGAGSDVPEGNEPCHV